MLMIGTGRTFTNELLGGVITDIQNPVIDFVGNHVIY